MAKIAQRALLLVFFTCSSVYAQDWQKPLEQICRRYRFELYPDYSDRSPLGDRVEVDNKGRFLSASKPHAGVSTYSEVRTGHKPDIDEVYTRGDKLKASGLLKKFNLKDFTLESNRKAVFSFHNLETTSMEVIPQSNPDEFKAYAVVDEVLKVGSLILRICSDDPNDKQKSAQQSVQPSDNASVCGTSVNVTADYSGIGGSFSKTKSDQYIVAGANQYIGIKATFYDLGPAISMPGTLSKGKGMDFGSLWMIYNGADRTNTDKVLYKFRLNIRPAENPILKTPTAIQGFNLSDNPPTPISDCGEHCFDVELQGLQSSRPFRISNLWGELTVQQEFADGSVGVVLTAMRFQTRTPKIKRRKLVVL